MAQKRLIFVRAHAPWTKPSVLELDCQQGPSFQVRRLGVRQLEALSLNPLQRHKLSNAKSLVLTSLNAWMSLKTQGYVDLLPKQAHLFCVGGRTKEVAQLFGFNKVSEYERASVLETQVHSQGAADVAPLVYCRCSQIRHSMTALKHAFGPAFEEIECYRPQDLTLSSADWQNFATQSQSTGCDQNSIYLFYSLETARLFLTLFKQSGLRFGHGGKADQAVCISPEVADMFDGLEGLIVHKAEAPTERHMAAILERL